MPLTGLQLICWAVITMQQQRPRTSEVLGHPTTYSMDRDMWLNQRDSRAGKRRFFLEGEVGSGALCHVQARIECLFFNRLAAERRKAMTELEEKKEHMLHFHWFENGMFEKERMKKCPI